MQSGIICCCCIGFGVLLSAIANVGIKLNHIENRVKGTSDDDCDSLSD